MALCAWTRNDICLVASPMSHHIVSHMGGSDQDNLSAGRVALVVLNAREHPCRIAGAVEDDSCCGLECCSDAFQLLPDKADPVLLAHSRIQVFHEFGGVDCHCGERNRKLDTGGEVFRGDNLELEGSSATRRDVFSHGDDTDVLEVLGHGLDLSMGYLIVP